MADDAVAAAAASLRAQELLAVSAEELNASAARVESLWRPAREVPPSTTWEALHSALPPALAVVPLWAGACARPDEDAADECVGVSVTTSACVCY